MLRILLVYDNFQELTAVELMLKKIGFDVLGITSEFSLPEQLLAFNPQIVIGQGRSPKISTSGVGRRLRESQRWDGQSILIFFADAKPQPTEILKMRMDVGLEHPVAPTQLVQVISQLAGLDSNQLLDKLIKSMNADGSIREPDSSREGSTTQSGSDSVFVSGSSGMPPAEKAQVISNKENSFPVTPIQDPLLQELEDMLTGKPKAAEAPLLQDSKRAQVYANILKNQPPLEGGSFTKREAKSRLRDLVDPLLKEELKNQDDLRRDFVKALFKRGT